MDRNPVLLYKTLVVGVILLLLCMSVSPSVAIDNVKKSTYPIGSGNTLYVGGSGEGNYTSIQDAINDAIDGDTVFVYDDSSPYYENLVVYKSINLIGDKIDKNGENNYLTVIDSNQSGDVIIVTADWVNISRFTIQNSGENSSDSGISVKSNNNTIKHNNIQNNRIGINFIWNYNIDNNNVLNNTIKSNSIYGVMVGKCKYLTIGGNEITENGASGIFLTCSRFTNISYNVISNNNGEGINMQMGCNDSLISDNNITNTGVFGLWLIYSHRCIVRNNYFEKCGWEILIMELEEAHEPSNHLVYHNNIMDRYGCEDLGTSWWDNGYPSGGNYYKDYDGIDYFSGPNQDIPGSDGIGDTPYTIPVGNVDNYPLMEPYGKTKLSNGFRTKLFSFSGEIKNIGDKTALNVQYKIKIKGGLVLGRNTHEIIPMPMMPGEETTITPGNILGFGRITVIFEVWADNAPVVSESRSGFLFLWFVLVK